MTRCAPSLKALWIANRPTGPHVLAEGIGGITDTVLHLRSLVRDPIKEAYGISKAMARTNEVLKSMLAPVIDFYAAAAKAAAASRKANAAVLLEAERKAKADKASKE